MVHKSLVTLFSPGALAQLLPGIMLLILFIANLSLQQLIGLLDTVQHLCSCTMQYFTSPLSLQREDLFITLDLNEIFSVLPQNFAFLP